MANALKRFIPQIVGEYPKAFLTLYNKISTFPHNENEEMKNILWKAYEFGVRKHDGQKRKSGESYFHSHCLEVAKTLANWNMDHITIIGGMLHDTIEDTDTSLHEIKEEFGTDVASLVDGVSKLGDITFSSRKAKQAGNFMKMLISVAQDLRVIIIKFADRLHNMRTIKHLSTIKRHRIAVETRDVYVPLAHRLGMAQVKWKLDDVVEEYGIKGLEWLQRKIYGGSWVPESWSQKLLNKRKKDLETEYGSGAGEGNFSDVETGYKLIKSDILKTLNLKLFKLVLF